MKTVQRTGPRYRTTIVWLIAALIGPSATTFAAPADTAIRSALLAEAATGAGTISASAQRWTRDEVHRDAVTTQATQAASATACGTSVAEKAAFVFLLV